MRWIAILVCWAALAGGATAGQAQVVPAKSRAKQVVTHLVLPPVPKALLPDSFAGWVATGAPKKITATAQADPVNAAALKEYEFTDGELSVYKRSGETLACAHCAFTMPAAPTAHTRSTGRMDGQRKRLERARHPTITG